MFERLFNWYLDETTAYFEKIKDEEGMMLVKEAIKRKLKCFENASKYTDSD